MEIKGKVLEVGEIVQVTDSFKKRELIVEYAENPAYPEQIKFEAIQEKVHLLTELQPGDECTVSFNLKGRGTPDKNNPAKKNYFNQLQVWAVKSVSQPLSGTSGGTVTDYAPPADISSAPEEDDLPF